MADYLVLPLSDVDDVADWLGDINPGLNEQNRITDCLAAAREYVTGEVHGFDTSVAAVNLPAALHLACRMIAAKLYNRTQSLQGIEAYDGEGGGVGLQTDPDVSRLLRQYRMLKIGGYP